jgi:hypothetical protein
MNDDSKSIQRVMREQARRSRVANRYNDLVGEAHRLLNDRDPEEYRELVEIFMAHHWNEREFQLWFTCPTSWLNFGIPICLWDTGDDVERNRVREAAYRTVVSGENR